MVCKNSLLHYKDVLFESVAGEDHIKARAIDLKSRRVADFVTHTERVPDERDHGHVGATVGHDVERLCDEVST